MDLEDTSFVRFWVVLFIVDVSLLFFIKFAWGWIVPDVFSDAVAQGILPATITSLQASKFVVVIAAGAVTRLLIASK